MKAICLTYWRVPFPSSRSGLCTNINMDGMVTITKSDFFAMLWNQIKYHLCIHSEHFGRGFCCRHKQVVPDQQNSFIYQANGSEKCYLYEIPSMHALTHHGSAEASHSLTLFIIENCQMAITHQYFWKFPEKVHCPLSWWLQTAPVSFCWSKLIVDLHRDFCVEGVLAKWDEFVLK
jgi:hypothetical protein